MIDITDFIQNNITGKIGFYVSWNEGRDFRAFTEAVGKEAYRALGGDTGWVLY